LISAWFVRLLLAGRVLPLCIFRGDIRYMDKLFW
jgi:hypothetical protein